MHATVTVLYVQSRRFCEQLTKHETAGAAQLRVERQVRIRTKPREHLRRDLSLDIALFLPHHPSRVSPPHNGAASSTTVYTRACARKAANSTTAPVHLCTHIVLTSCFNVFLIFICFKLHIAHKFCLFVFPPFLCHLVSPSAPRGPAPTDLRVGVRAYVNGLVRTARLDSAQCFERLPRRSHKTGTVRTSGRGVTTHALVVCIVSHSPTHTRCFLTPPNPTGKNHEPAHHAIPRSAPPAREFFSRRGRTVRRRVTRNYVTD